MAYIQPNSNIILIQGCPCDRDYTHTLHFNSKLEQDQYFTTMSSSKILITANTYIRHTKNSIKVEINPDRIIGYNYLCFQNTAYTNKWFYAFIDEVKYVNDVTAEIIYTLDLMQTYMFDYSLGSCFVKREHTAEDYVGYNLVPEDLTSPNEIVSNVVNKRFNNDNYLNNSEYCIVIHFIPNLNNSFRIKHQYDETLFNFFVQQDPTTKIRYVNTYNIENAKYTQAPSFIANGNIFSGDYLTIKYELFNPKNDDEKDKMNFQNQAFQLAVKTLTENSATIVDLYLVPVTFLTTCIHTYEKSIDSNIISKIKDIVVFQPKGFKSFKTNQPIYYPHNAKLYQYPFSWLRIDNNNGDYVDYHWEDFNDEYKATFSMFGSIFPDTKGTIFPTNYLNEDINYQKSFIINVFPQPLYSIDKYTEWKARNSGSLIAQTTANAIKGIGKMVGGIATGNPATMIGGGLDIVGTGFDTFATISKAKNTPNTYEGGNDVGLNVITDLLGYSCKSMTYRQEDVIRIDRYFDMYGYAVNNVKIPNIATTNIRPKFNYIQTGLTSIISTSLSAEVEEKIKSVYQKGITFWNNPNEVGNYSETILTANSIFTRPDVEEPTTPSTIDEFIILCIGDRYSVWNLSVINSPRSMFNLNELKSFLSQYNTREVSARLYTNDFNDNVVSISNVKAMLDDLGIKYVDRTRIDYDPDIDPFDFETAIRVDISVIGNKWYSGDRVFLTYEELVAFLNGLNPKLYYVFITSDNPIENIIEIRQLHNACNMNQLHYYDLYQDGTSTIKNEVQLTCTTSGYLLDDVTYTDVVTLGEYIAEHYAVNDTKFIINVDNTSSQMFNDLMNLLEFYEVKIIEIPIKTEITIRVVNTEYYIGTTLYTLQQLSTYLDDLNPQEFMIRVYKEYADEVYTTSLINMITSKGFSWYEEEGSNKTTLEFTISGSIYYFLGSEINLEQIDELLALTYNPTQYDVNIITSDTTQEAYMELVNIIEYNGYMYTTSPQ